MKNELPLRKPSLFVLRLSPENAGAHVDPLIRRSLTFPPRSLAVCGELEGHDPQISYSTCRPELGISNAWPFRQVIALFRLFFMVLSQLNTAPQ